MRSVFLGTPEAAVPALGALVEISDVRAVLTQPDRPKGRSRTPTPPPVGEAAAALGLDVHQPGSSREIGPILEALGPVDVAVVVAYGMLIRSDALDVPRRGFVNLHFSVLPRWRGAAPVQRAIEAGDPRTGVTLMQLDEGLDTGPILSTLSTGFRPAETAGEVLARLARAGGRLLGSRLADHVGGRIVPVPQDGSLATHAAKISSEERRLDLTDPAERVVGKILALSPSPGAHAMVDGERFKILRARVSSEPTGDRGVGEMWITGDGNLLARLPDAAVELMDVQPAGKKPMAGAVWARGRHGRLGDLT